MLTAAENSDEETNNSLDAEKTEKMDNMQDVMDIKKDWNDDVNSALNTSELFAKENETSLMSGEDCKNIDMKEENSDVASPSGTDNTEEMDFREEITENETNVQQECDHLKQYKALADFTNGGRSGTLSNGDHKPISTKTLLELQSEDSTSNKKTMKIKSEADDEYSYAEPQQSDTDEANNLLRQRVKIEPEDISTEAQAEQEDEEGTSTERSKRPHVNLCRHELIGLRVLHHQLENLPVSKRCVPMLIPNPDSLLQHAKVNSFKILLSISKYILCGLLLYTFVVKQYISCEAI